MSTAKCDDIVVPIFDGSDYKLWKQRMIVLLKYKKCVKPIERAQAATDTAATWLDMDIKAMNYLYSALSNRQLEYVTELGTSFEIISKLDSLYDKPSTALQILCRNSLENIKLQDFTDIDQFFNKFEKAANDLKAAGASLSEDEKLNYMLKSLPAEYSHIGDSIDVVPEDQKTVEYLKNKIRLKSLEQKHLFKEEKQQSNTFAATRSMNRGQRGHFGARGQRGNHFGNRGSSSSPQNVNNNQNYQQG